MKKQLALLFAIALSFVPALVADSHLDGVQSVKYDVLLSPSHENPPIEGLDISGDATVEITVTRQAGAIVSAIVDFHVNWRSSQPEELRAMHIHRGAAGVNGPVVVDTDLGVQAASTGSTIFRQAMVTNFALIEEIMANPGGFYLNVHSATNPPRYYPRPTDYGHSEPTQDRRRESSENDESSRRSDPVRVQFPGPKIATSDKRIRSPNPGASDPLSVSVPPHLPRQISALSTPHIA